MKDNVKAFHASMDYIANPSKGRATCSICGDPYRGFGNNAWPVNDGRCCDVCNALRVVPLRIARLYRREK